MAWRDRFIVVACPPEVPWRLIASDLKHVGVSYAKQAEGMGRGWSTMQKWIAGGQPPFPEAVAWLAMHKRFCGEELTAQRLRVAAENSASPSSSAFANLASNAISNAPSNAPAFALTIATA